MYDPDADQWSRIASLTNARDGPCCVSDGELVYAIGGYSGSRYLLSSEVYDEETGSWNGASKYLIQHLLYINWSSCRNFVNHTQEKLGRTFFQTAFQFYEDHIAVSITTSSVSGLSLLAELGFGMK